MENMGMSKFEVVDLPGMKTMAFIADRSDEATGISTFSLEKIEHNVLEDAGNTKKVFSVLNNQADEHFIVLLTLADNKAYLNTGVLSNQGFQKSNEILPISYGTLYNQNEVEYKEYTYNVNLKRHFSIIDTQTCEEIKPTLYVEPMTNLLKGRYKLLPYRAYIVLELGVEQA